MIQLVLALLLFLVSLSIFYILGEGVNRIFKLHLLQTELLLLGFFSYFALFQFIYLPLMINLISFGLLVLTWLSFLCILLVLILGLYGRQIVIDCARSIRKSIMSLYDERSMLNIQKIFRVLSPLTVILLVMVLLLIGMTFLYQVFYSNIFAHYTDTAFYLGTIQSAIYTNTIFIYDGTTGLRDSFINMRFALTGFYINSAIWCRVFRISPIVYQQYVWGGILVVLYTKLTLLIGGVIFKNSTKRVLSFVICCLILNFVFLIYTTPTGAMPPEFLLLFGNQTKGLFANVIIPMLFYIYLVMVAESRKGKYWVFIFIIALSSMGISGSAILIVPAFVFLVALTEFILSRKVKTLFSGIVCLIPCAIYIFAFSLFVLNIWRIPL